MKIHRIPYVIIRVARNFVGKSFALTKGLSFAPPNYVYFDRFNADSICVDVGCASDPDFSEFLMNTYGCKSFGVDPTRKHTSALAEFATKTGGRFIHLPYAIGGKNGVIQFHESNDKDSGSIREDHVNILNGNTISYEVSILTIEKLLSDHVKSNIAMLKLDLEGAEYDLIAEIVPSHLETIDQIFVEFHHHCIDEYSKSDTIRCVTKLVNCGFSKITVDGHNYLFYRN